MTSGRRSPIKRGEIYWLDEGSVIGAEIKKDRPHVVVGVNAINKARKTVIVVPLSRSAPLSPPVVTPVFAMGQTVGAICDQIRAADKARFAEYPEGSLSDEDMLAIDASLKEVMGL